MISNMRLLYCIEGMVQGVGFRPFVYTLALRHTLSGFVLNNEKGVTIEFDGSKES
ncbi:MAG: acylphosphatase, partial [Sulfurospirillum sp.]|nr:acylphosphatase [Sulfurospirillum sp.]